LVFITCGGARSRGGIKFLLAPGLVSLILPLHFGPLPALILLLKGLIVQKPPGLSRIRTVDMLTIGADHPDLSVSGAASYRQNGRCKQRSAKGVHGEYPPETGHRSATWMGAQGVMREN
jgi:hypothetical protein